MMFSFLPRRPALALLLLLGLAPQQLQAQTGNNALPEMGDSSATLLSREDEQRIGREMMRQLDNSGIVNQDPLINTYIQEVGRSLSSAAVDGSNDFRFFVIDKTSINAFAMPGGYIGVHAGLILASESENELASVLAHEIAHVTQHHIARSVEKANQMNLPVTAAVIAAILLGGVDPQAANAALTASIGGAQQLQLDFTRANEKEADRVGMQLLASSDYDPRGMSGFFARLQNETRYYGSGTPEFLRTHPVTTSRLAEAADRARQYPQRQRENSIDYLLTKARLRLNSAESPARLARQLDTEQAQSLGEREAQRYLRALLLQRQGDNDQAKALFSELLKQHPGRIAYIHSLAQLESEQGNHNTASAHYAQGLQLYPGNLLLGAARARSLMDGNRFDESVQQLKALQLEHARAPRLYSLLAEVEAKRGNSAASYLAQAEYYYLSGEPHSAIDQLNLARRIQPLDDYHQSRIEARLLQLKEEIALSRH